MQYTHLGRSGLKVSRLVPRHDELRPADRRSRLARDHGRRPRAGHQLLRHRERLRRQPSTAAATEEIIGRWFAKGGGRRERTVLATKLYGDMGDRPNEGKLSALNIRRALDASLKRLQTDYIDLYQFHHVDRDTPWDEIWQAIDVAVQQGKILYVGQQQLRRLAHRAGAGGRRAAATTPGWSASSPSTTCSPATSSWRSCPPRSTTALGSSRGRRCTAGCSAACCARRTRGRAPPRGPGGGDAREATATQIEAYEDFADELGHEPGDVALAWLLASRP